MKNNDSVLILQQPEELLRIFLDELEKSPDFKFISGLQPFLIVYANRYFYIYIKNISSAYFSDRSYTTRAQLPRKPIFDKIKTSPHTFIFLGYDSLTEVFVCWNFHVVKQRLNESDNVSLYSRSHFQREVVDDIFYRKHLTNGDNLVLFKRPMLIDFFNKIDSFFPGYKNISMFCSKSFVNRNFKNDFVEFLQSIKKLSVKSIQSYSNALEGRLSGAIRDNFIPDFESIFYLEDITILKDLYLKLFNLSSYRELDKTGKKMYSCAFLNYIEFQVFRSSNIDEPIINSVYEKDGKLIKIKDSHVLNEVIPLIKSNKLLSAIQFLGNYYHKEYPDMELTDWMKVVKNI